MSERQSFLITGASSYLGKVLSNYLSKKDSNKVFLTSRSVCNFKDLENLDHVKYLPNIDLLKENDLQKLRSEVEDFFGGKFNIIHSVGYFRAHEPFENTNLEEAKNMVASHYLTLYGVVYAMLPLLRQRKGGHIIAFSCNSVKYRYPYMISFTAAKAAIESFIGGIANEFGKDGILANALALSSLQTPFVRESKPFGDYEHYIHLEDIAALCEELVKNPFKLMNGNTLSLYEYSDTFFHQGYFERIKTK
jgi:short-subunit dehydrogenase